MVDNLLKNNLHFLMSRERLTATHLGQLINLPAVTIKKIRSGENENPTISTLMPIAKYFNISISQLVGEHLINKDSFAFRDNNFDKNSKIRELPLITWEDSISWPNISNRVINKLLECSYPFSVHSFCLECELVDYGFFQKGGIIFIDPDATYDHNDYILVHKLGQQRPSVKKVLKDDDIFYLQSMIDQSFIIKFSFEHRILGVVVLYKKQFKELQC